MKGCAAQEKDLALLSQALSVLVGYNAAARAIVSMQIADRADA